MIRMTNFRVAAASLYGTVLAWLFFFCHGAYPSGFQPSHSIPSWVFFDCSVHPRPGVYADRVRGCHVFNFCTKGGLKFEMVCPNNTLFDNEKQDCISASLVKCPTIWEVPEPTHPPKLQRANSSSSGGAVRNASIGLIGLRGVDVTNQLPSSTDVSVLSKVEVNSSLQPTESPSTASHHKRKFRRTKKRTTMSQTPSL